MEPLYNLSRIMCEKDKQLHGMNGIPIVAGAVKVEEDDKLVIGDRVFNNNTIDKKDFDYVRGILNTNTLKSHLQKKSPDLAKSLTKALPHTEIRKHAIIMRKCIKTLDKKVCSDCKKNPHSMPAKLIKDLPPRELGSGALFWDTTSSTEHPGDSCVSQMNFF